MVNLVILEACIDPERAVEECDLFPLVEAITRLRNRSNKGWVGASSRLYRNAVGTLGEQRLDASL